MRKTSIDKVCTIVDGVIEKRGSSKGSPSDILRNMAVGGLIGGTGLGAWTYLNSYDSPNKRNRIRKSLLSAAIGATGGSLIGGGYGAYMSGYNSKTPIGGTPTETSKTITKTTPPKGKPKAKTTSLKNTSTPPKKSVIPADRSEQDYIRDRREKGVAAAAASGLGGFIGSQALTGKLRDITGGKHTKGHLAAELVGAAISALAGNNISNYIYDKINE